MSKSYEQRILDIIINPSKDSMDDLFLIEDDNLVLPIVISKYNMLYKLKMMLMHVCENYLDVVVIKRNNNSIFPLLNKTCTEMIENKEELKIYEDLVGINNDKDKKIVMREINTYANEGIYKYPKYHVEKFNKNIINRYQIKNGKVVIENNYIDEKYVNEEKEKKYNALYKLLLFLNNFDFDCFLLAVCYYLNKSEYQHLVFRENFKELLIKINKIKM